jgi:outer membrane protein assembly factor BamE
MRILAFLFLALFLAGCGYSIVHKIDVQQGNYVPPETAAKLKKGMTKSDVRQLMGTPLLTDMFHGNRWDYYFRNEKAGRLEERTRLSLFFEDEKLVAVTGDVAPHVEKPEAPAAAGASAPAPASAPAATPAATPASAPSPAPVPAPKK